ncbi:hypothetical protein K438DRAFT_584131 [Mycena galopus ATCC 62051]|nr:hypothetical protein K438DRAFT_584131 [Mycena galopus ATCC 62051]
MEYTHHGSTLSFRVPGRNVVKSRVMKMGEDTVEGTRKMFETTISCGGTHYVTNDGHLEDLLIDFRELVGEHSGENMADSIWKTVEFYGLEGKVCASLHILLTTGSG